MPIHIRDVRPDDAAAIAAIYRTYVETSRISFETVAPDADEIARRIKAITGEGFPYIVAEEDGVVLGYTYVTTFRARAAYNWCVEDSVYVCQGQERKGIGHALMMALIKACEAKDYRQMIAGISLDPVLGPKSIAFHKAHGFEHMGTLPDIGFKDGAWTDVVFLQRALGAGAETLPAMSLDEQ